MYWWVILDTSQGLKAIGPYTTEEDATDAILETQAVTGNIGYYEIFPSAWLRPERVVEEWKVVKGG